MTDEGLDALMAIEAWGNWWHGSYHQTLGWRSRAGVALPAEITANSAAIDARNRTDTEAHLVDFGLPEVATPAAEAAAGLLRWNKALLFGREKAYNIKSGGQNFGRAGWPYRAPDGTVWHLKIAWTTSGQIEIYGRVLTPAFANPMTLVATPSWSGLPGWSASRALAVTFAPNGGAAAAVHWRTVADNALNGVLELAVSGGSATTPPTVSASLTYPNVASLTTTGSYPSGAITATSYVNGTTVWTGGASVYTAPPAGYDPAHYATETIPTTRDPISVPIYYGSPHWTRTVLGVVYGADGTRHVLSRGDHEHTPSFTDSQSIVATGTASYLAYRASASDPWVRGASLAETGVLIASSGSRHLHGEMALERDGAPVASLHTYRDFSSSGIYNTATGTWSDTTVSDVTSGNYTGSAPRSSGMSNDTVAWIGDDVAHVVYAWAGADHAQAYGDAAAVSLDGTNRICVDPVTGAFDPAITRRF